MKRKLNIWIALVVLLISLSVIILSIVIKFYVVIIMVAFPLFISIRDMVLIAKGRQGRQFD